MTYELHVIDNMRKPWHQFLALRDFWDAQKHIKPFSSTIRQSASARDALTRAVPLDTSPGERDQATEVPPASVAETHLSLVVGIPDGQSDPALRDRWVRQRIQSLSKPALESLAARWPVSEIQPPAAHPEPYNDSEMDALVKLIDAIEAEHAEPFGAADPTLPAAPPAEPFTERAPSPERPDEGDIVDPSKVAAIATTLQALTTSQQAFIEDVCARSLNHGYSMNLEAGATRRKWLLARCLIWMVEIFDKESDFIGGCLVGGDLGEWCAYSPIEDVISTLHMLIEIRAGKRALLFDESDGMPRFPLADESNRVLLTDEQVATMLEAV